MTPEQRLDRLERIAKLFVRAGFRDRKKQREQDERIIILTNAQIATEEQFVKVGAALTRLAESQVHTDRRLDALIDIVRDERNGKAGDYNASS